jgi:hypothetical protein
MVTELDAVFLEKNLKLYKVAKVLIPRKREKTRFIEIKHPWQPGRRV